MRTKLLIIIGIVASLVWGGVAFFYDQSLIPDLVTYCKALVLGIIGLVLRDMPAGQAPVVLPVVTAQPVPPDSVTDSDPK